MPHAGTPTVVAADDAARPAAPIYFNRPRLAGRELEYIADAVAAGDTAGDGRFSARCNALLESRLGARRVMLTNSCTAALEVAALLCAFEPGDEVLMPSFTYPSTANAVVRAGARPVFVDVRPDTLNLDERTLDAARTPRTRAIVPVHYAGVACEMDAILAFAQTHGLRVIEDAAHGIDSRYRGRALGTLGDFGCLSFHETKNVHCGQGGALIVSHADDEARAEILRDRGTDRQRFLRGEVPHYRWVDVGSSFVLGEILCAYLFAQLEALDGIGRQRARLWHWYADGLAGLAARGRVRLPVVPPSCTPNHHLFFVLVDTGARRDDLAHHLEAQGVQALSHYVPLHQSPFAERLGPQPRLPVTEAVSQRLLRLPLHLHLDQDDVGRVVDGLETFFAA